LYRPLFCHTAVVESGMTLLRVRGDVVEVTQRIVAVAVGAAFVAYSEAFESVEPGEAAFDGRAAGNLAAATPTSGTAR
jgi:hypothetical protein